MIVFKLSGEHVTTIGTEGNGDGEFSIPAGLTLSSTGLLFVCDTGNKRVQVFNTQQNHQFQYSIAQGKFIIDLTLNVTEDKLFTLNGMCILVYTPQGQFLYSIITCGLFTVSICSTSDGHLLVGNRVSSTFLSVYHEDGTLVCGGDHGNDVALIMEEEPDSNFAVHVMNNGLFMTFCENYYGRLSFNTRYGAVLL